MNYLSRSLLLEFLFHYREYILRKILHYRIGIILAIVDNLGI